MVKIDEEYCSWIMVGLKTFKRRATGIEAPRNYTVVTLLREYKFIIP